MNVQERLQLKRIPLDKWSTREQLFLAMAVLCSGDQNWMSVSRALKMMCGNSRPSDWFSQKFCAAQYGKLLENVETPKRKKRTATERDNPSDTIIPGELIVRKLVQERNAELKKLVEDEQREYRQLASDIRLLQSDALDDNQILAMYRQIENEKREKEKEQQKHAQWLKEREEKKIEMERAWRPGAVSVYQNVNSMSPNSNSNSSGSPSRNSPSLTLKMTGLGIPPLTKSESVELADVSMVGEAPLKQGTSPLLTSLLKSPSSTPSTPTVAINARNLAPTITNLLTGQVPVVPVASPLITMDVPNSSAAFFQFNSNHPQFQPVLNTPTKAAPTLSKLLDNNKKQEAVGSFEMVAMKAENKDEDVINMDDDQQLLEVFKELMPDDLADILTDNNEMIVSPELLDQDLGNVAELMPTTNDPVEPKKERGGVEALKAVLEGATEEPVVRDVVQMHHQIEAPKNEEIEGKFPDFIEESGQQVVVVQEEEKIAEAPPIPHYTEVEETEAITVEEQARVISVEGEEPTDPLEEQLALMNNDTAIQSEETTGGEGEVSTYPEGKLEEQVPMDQYPMEEESEAMENPIENLISEEDEEVEEKEEENNEEIREADNTGTDTVEQTQVEEETGEPPIVPEVSKPIAESIEEAKKVDERKVSTDNEDHFEDAKSSLEEVDPVTQEEEKDVEMAPAAIVPTKETSESAEEEIIKVQPTENVSESVSDRSSRSKRDMPRRSRGQIEEKTPQPIEKRHLEDSGEETKSSSASNISLRTRLKERERSESPLVMDEDTNDVIPRTRRRYSSTPVIDSIPSSPASGDDREYKNWKKTVFIAFNQFSTLHYKYSAVLVQQVPEEFRHIILRPMDMQTIKKNIETGVYRTTMEFQRDILLMVQNAIMMNTRRDRDWLNLMKDMVAEVYYWKKETEKNLNSRESDVERSSRDGQSKVRNRKSQRIAS